MELVNFSFDLWMTTLSYFKDTNSETVNPTQLIAIMKMSFVSKGFRNLITSNDFWVLYNSDEYKSAKYNIYDCNENFCRIIHKIMALKTKQNIIDSGQDILYVEGGCCITTSGGIKDNSETYDKIEYDDKGKMINIDNLKIMCYNGQKNVKFNISNNEIVYTYAKSINRNILAENDYCIILGFKYGEHVNIIKKPIINIPKSYDNACDIFNNSIRGNCYKLDEKIHHYYQIDVVLHDNYIWLTTKTYFSDYMIINFYSINVITTATYLIYEIKQIYDVGTRYNNQCDRCFFKKY